MTEQEFAINTYEQLLNDEIKTFSPYFFIPQYRKNRVIHLIKYLVEQKMKISPENALDIISHNFLKKYKLEIIIQYIDKPSEFADNDLRYIILYAYPDLKVPGNEEQAIKVYEDVLIGKRKNFPKNYFLGGEKGERRAIACFKYLCEQRLKMTTSEIIEHFSSSKGLQTLSRHKLKIIMNVLFSSLIDLLECAYPGELQAYTNQKKKGA